MLKKKAFRNGAHLRFLALQMFDPQRHVYACEYHIDEQKARGDSH